MNTSSICSRPPIPIPIPIPIQATSTQKQHPSKLFPLISKCKNTNHLTQIHAHFIKTRLIHDPLAAAELLRHLSATKTRNLTYASKLFHQMETLNCFSFNTLIRAFAECTDNEAAATTEAIQLFVEMLCDDFVEPNKFTFPSVLKACALSGRVNEGKQIHGLVVKYGFGFDEFVVSNLVRMYVMCGVMDDAEHLFRSTVSIGCGNGNVVLWNVMIDGYVRVGDFATAEKLFDEMPERSVVSWNVMVSGYAQNGFFKEALELFRKMQMVGDDGVFPNYVTLVSVLPAISQLGALELGKWVHLYVEKKGIGIDDKLGSALVDMYSKCGSIEKAIQVFQSLPKRNTITWSSVIGGLAMNGRAKDALRYFSRMEQDGVKPNDALFTCILSACSHAGLVEQGRSFFDKITDVGGVEPKIEHYGCMVDLLGRAGLLEEAEVLILTMPIKPDDVIWKTLLGACKIHGNIDMGERIANILMDLAPNDSGSYVALSNMYAAMDNWKGVARVRLKMKEMDIRKDPGCSWIELDGAVHEFLVEDDSHPKAQEIHSMLEEISDKLKQSRYRPNTSQVLLNTEEGAKESALHYHSEKIAIAFGLISTSPGTPLRIVKNLRICEDCHSSIKLISKFYERRIIVRDRKRFHHFEHGSCSCRDYW